MIDFSLMPLIQILGEAGLHSSCKIGILHKVFQVTCIIINGNASSDSNPLGPLRNSSSYRAHIDPLLLAWPAPRWEPAARVSLLALDLACFLV